MEIEYHWKSIQKLFNNARNSSMHFALATVTKDGSPHVTPIGSLFLRENITGFFFDEFPINLPKNIEENPKVCILAVNSNPTYWQKSLIIGKFISPPSVRLIGSIKEKRDGTEEEIAIWQNHVKDALGTKGHTIMWKNMRTVRDIHFDSFEPVTCGEMTQELWK